MALSVGVASPQGSQQGSVYWIGQDGNVYLKNGSGVTNQGRAQGSATTANLVLNGAREIDDPNVGMKNVSSTTTGTPTGTSSTPAKVVNTAAVSATQQALDSLGTESAVRNKSIDDNLNSVIGGYDQDAAKATEDFNTQNDTNQNNLQKNKQNALVAGAQGARGLRSTLAAMGALGGDGIKLANRAVTDAANTDIGEAVDTATTNATTLQKSKKDFDDEDAKRRAQAQTEAANNRTAAEGAVLTKRQQYLQKLADLFNDGGDTGNANRYLGEAGALNNEIAQKGAVAATPITARSAAFTPGDLDTYLGGAGDMTVTTAEGDNGASGDATSILAARAKDKDKKQQQLVAA